LAANPRDAKALLNAGYFLQSWDVTRFHFTVSAAIRRAVEPSAGFDAEVESPTGRATKHYDAPLAYYLEALSMFPENAHDDLEAKLLYQLIRCFGATTEGYNCRPFGEDGAQADVPAATRKAWFTKLKKKYPGSSWAAKTKYWY
jgi:hypothetical protein